MERHKCKLCMRSFSNGRALGGHMRSHMMNLPVPPRPEEYQEEQEEQEGEAIPLPPRFAIDDDEEEDDEEEEDEESMYYGLRENPKRSMRLVDHEFSFAVEAAGCVVLQDRESETESSKNPTRRRSKRTRKSGMLDVHHHNHDHHHHQKFEALKKIKLKNKVVISSKTDSFEPEPVSSVSDATTEEDVAFCLMMLSRDKWKKQELQDQLEHEHEDDEAERSMEETDESEEQLTIKYPKTRPSRGKYKCETCNKVFKSYQALGGHRASHKKIKALNPTPVNEPEFEQENNAGTSSSVPERKIHECPVCFRVFASGQALGGHKRSHVTGAAAAATTTMKSLSKLGDNLIDLNLPAPLDDDDDEISQIELSAVSDAEFVNPIRR